MLKLNKISKSFGNRTILQNISYEFKENGLYSILASSGTGKSTLLNIMSLLDSPDMGEIFFNSKNLSKLNEKEKRSFRLKNIGFVFQSFNLFEHDTVLNNVSILLDGLSIPKKKKEKLIDKVLFKLDIYDLKDEIVSKLSGGEKQRVALARSLLLNPNIIFADEPTGSLDEENSNIIFSLFKELSKDHLIIVVTHNEELAKKYSNYLLYLNKDKLKEEKIVDLNEKGRKKNKEINHKEKLSFSFKFKNFINGFKSKKVKNTFLISFLSFSFSVGGLTMFLKDSFANIISDTFEELSNENSVILKRKDNDPKILSYFSASKDDLAAIYKNNSNEIKRIGTTYLNNLLEFFPDEDKLTLHLNNRFNDTFLLKNYNSISFANYTYVPSTKNISHLYPKVEKLGTNDLILGLTNEEMLNLTSLLYINSTFESLGNYIKKEKPYVILSLKNNYWTYEDEQLFNLRGIVLDNKSTIYSTNPFFNEYVFEEKMLFPSTNYINEELEFPWILKKVHYFETFNLSSNLINKLIQETEYKNYIFDLDNSYYNETYYEYDHLENISSNKVYCYQSLKRSVDMVLLKSIIDKLNFKDYYFNTTEGYVNYSSLMSGFYNPTYFSFDLNKINEVVDLKDKISIEDYYYLSLDGLANGNYLNQNSENVKFNSKMNKNIYGSYPINNNEIAISKGLASLLKVDEPLNKDIYISSIVNFKQKDENTLIPELKTISLKVSGIVESNRVEIYHNPYFSLTLFRDLFRISSFKLNIDSITFLLDKKIDEKEINLINESIDEFEFYSPLTQINKTIDETLSYVLLFLYIFVFISSLSSIILFIIFSFINFLEKKKEVALLIVLGFQNKEIINYFLFSNFGISLMSFSIGSVSIFILSFLISFIIQIMFKTSFSFYLSSSSFLMMIILLLIFVAFSILLILLPLYKLDYKKELHC